MSTKSRNKPIKASSGMATPKKTGPGKPGANDLEQDRRVGRRIVSSEVAAYRVLQAADKEITGSICIDALVDVLREQAAAVCQNDMSNIEGMLMNQATALQCLFARLSEKALGAEYVSTFDTMMKMSLRAQSQCRATLETLAAIKNPPLVIAKQANVTSGPQQINNGVEASSRARENENVQFKLSGDNNELLPNTGTPCVASETYSTLEAVGEVHRAKVRRGKG